VFNFFTASLSALIIAQFEETIREVAVAAALMTMIAAMSGNAGTQTMTVLVRGIALGEDLHDGLGWLTGTDNVAQHAQVRQA
jgi:magnesium transporter